MQIDLWYNALSNTNNEKSYDMINLAIRMETGSIEWEEICEKLKKFILRHDNNTTGFITDLVVHRGLQNGYFLLNRFEDLLIKYYCKKYGTKNLYPYGIQGDYYKYNDRKALLCINIREQRLVAIVDKEKVTAIEKYNKNYFIINNFSPLDLFNRNILDNETSHKVTDMYSKKRLKLKGREEELKSMAERGLGLTELAKIFDVSVPYVSSKLTKMGIRKYRKIRKKTATLLDGKEEQIEKLLDTDMNIPMIANILGVHKETVYHYLRKKYPERKRTKRIVLKKLEKEKERIKKMLDDNTTVASIAETLGVSRPTIYDYIKKNNLNKNSIEAQIERRKQQVKRLLVEDISLARIAKTLGLSYSTVYKYAKDK
jgi:DNA-binding CsgD family transcriptional regulator